jgi:methylated-DNA-[protein]-cysteine S-methyltransferase
VKKEAELPPLDYSPFTAQQTKVYAALAAVPFGSTISYGALAARCGMPKAARFVGSCMADNLFPVFIPCHRVLPSSGDIGNYSAGIEIKRFLLKHEGVL